MQLELTLIGSALVLAWAAFCALVRLEFELRAVGEPDGSWVIVAGFSALGFTLSLVHTSAAVARWQLHWLRYRLPLSLAKPKAVVAAPAPPGPASVRSRLDLVSLERGAALALRCGGRVRLDRLDLEVRYGFEDIALTGQLSGALYALAGALPRGVRLRQQPRWDGAERFELDAAGSLALPPLRVLADALWYMSAERRRARRLAPASAEVRT